MTQPQGAPGAPDSSSLAERLLRMMGELGYLQKKGKTDSGPRFTYVKHDDVVSAVSEAAVKHGVLVFSSVPPESIAAEVIGKTGSGADIWRTTLIVATQFIHPETGETLMATAPGEGVDTSDKGTGKAMSYALKNLLLKVFLIATGDEADNESAHIETQASSSRARKPAPASPAPESASMSPALARFWSVARDTATPNHPNKVPEEVVRAWFKRNLGLDSTKEASDDQLKVATQWASKFVANARRLAAATDVLGLSGREVVKQAGEMFPGVEGLGHLTIGEWEELIGWAEHKASVTLDQQATEDGDEFPFTTEGGTE